MVWWLLIATVIAAALAYGYWNHTRDSRHLAGLFADLAAKHRGQVKAGGLLALPQLRFELAGRPFLVTAMATSGSGTQDSGPFTLVDLELPVDSGAKIRVRRGRDLGKALIEAVVPGQRVATGHKAFDEAYQIHDGDQALAARFLDLRVRGRLLDSRLAGLTLRVKGQKVSIHMDGIAASTAELVEMIEFAGLLADRCPSGD